MSVPESGGRPRQKVLGIYLNDHLAGATAGAGLVRRMVREHGGTAHGDALRDLAAEVSQDRQTLLRLMADLGVPVKRYKLCGAWLGEKFSRAKPNGRLLRRSGLTLPVEVEAMRLATQGKTLLWRALLAAAARDPRLDPDGLEQLLRRAGQQSRALDALHDRVTTALLSPAPSPAPSSAGPAASARRH